MKSDDTPTATRLRRSVTSLGRRLRLARASHGVSSSGLGVLAHLLRSGALTATAIAARERVQPQSLTRILNDLESGEFLHRLPDATDRRRTRLEITAKGRSLLIDDARLKDEWLAKALSGLTEA